MTTPTLQALEAAEAFIAEARRDLYEGHSRGIGGIPDDDLLGLQGLAEIDEVLDKVRAALTAQPELPEPVGAQGGFIGYAWTGCTIEHHEMVQANPDEYRGYQTRLVYTAAQLQQAVEEAQTKREPIATPKPLSKIKAMQVGIQAIDLITPLGRTTTDVAYELTRFYERLHGIGRKE